MSSRTSKRLIKKISASHADNDPSENILQGNERTDGNIMHKRFWSISEKRALLESVQKHGLSDLDRIATDLKTRTVPEIQWFLNGRRAFLNAKYKNHCLKTQGNLDVPATDLIIHQWCDKVKEAVDLRFRGTDYSTVLLKAMEVAAQSESTKNLTAGEPSFALMYSYLAKAMAGFIPPSLPPTESWLMLHALKSLSDALKQSNWNEEKSFLRDLHLRKRVPVDPDLKLMSKEELWKCIKENCKETASVAEEHEQQSAVDQEPNTAGESSQASASALEAVGSGFTGFDPDTSEPPCKFVKWDLKEHTHGLLVCSLNPLNVPVSMLDHQSEVIFHTGT